MFIVFTLDQYLGSHAKTSARELTDEIKSNALALIAKIEKLSVFAPIGVRELFDRAPTSGWRPRAYNAKIGGAKNSKHITGQAVDVPDPEERAGGMD